jgi:hypothetical protein
MGYAAPYLKISRALTELRRTNLSYGTHQQSFEVGYFVIFQAFAFTVGFSFTFLVKFPAIFMYLKRFPFFPKKTFTIH